MKIEQKRTYKYSRAFKQKVAREIEEGKFNSLEEARKLYAIVERGIISDWIKQLGKNYAY